MLKLQIIQFCIFILLIHHITRAQTILPSLNTARLIGCSHTEAHLGFNFKSKTDVKPDQNQYYAQLFDVRLLYGIADNVNITVRFPVWTLSGTTRFVHGFGDLEIGTKIHILTENRIWPQAAFRFRTKLPNASDEKMLGSDLTDFFFDLLVSKTIIRSNIDVALGMGIISDTRTCLPRQFDVILGNATWTMPVFSSFLLKTGSNFMLGINRSTIDDKIHLSLGVAFPFKHGTLLTEFNKRVYGNNHDIGTPFYYSQSNLVRFALVLIMGS